MCGIAGLLALGNDNDLAPALQRMTDVLAHRGPDDEGRWFDAEQGIALGHRRLSIVDLSPQGHQPMVSVSGRWVLAFNGEIYNYRDLRAELESSGRAPAWRGHSDTEVLLAGIEAWGVEATLQRTVGMFAIAAWDRADRRLLLARDRIGEKPLYYGRSGSRWMFASELKAVRALCSGRLEIDREALATYTQGGYVPAPMSIYRGFAKLPAGHFVWLGQDGATTVPQPYWSLDTEAQRAATGARADIADANATDAVHERLKTAVGLQMVADVPLGAFLSGGIDSSLVVSLMQAQSAQPVRTFTIGFDDESYNEAPFAAAVARHLGTQHTELFVSADDAKAVIPRLAHIYDEPFADASQIPTTLVSRLTRQHVTVSLSGDGGDELFAGYPRYALSAALWHRIRRVPRPLRRALARVLMGVSPRRWDALLALWPGADADTVNGRRVHRFASTLNAGDLGELYGRLMAQWQPEEALVLGVAPQPLSGGPWKPGGSDTAQMRRRDLDLYLADDLMVKVDRAAMSTSLESRAPLLDHRVVELAFTLPDRVLMRGSQGKWVLRQVLDRYVPRALVERPKAGFGVPLGAWLRGPLRTWAADLLDPSTLRRQGLLDADKVSAAWRQHVDGRADRSTLLWTVLMFQAWQADAATAAA
jgi:asparagine synthase (glutamine-hydrolysing)